MTERREINRKNRGFGKSVERNVARVLGGERVPLSGAVKSDKWTLTGDVRVTSHDGERLVAILECKGTSAITPKGDKTFTLKKSVLDQARDEAAREGAIGAVWVHWKQGKYRQDDYVILPAATFADMIERLKA